MLLRHTVPSPTLSERSSRLSTYLVSWWSSDRFPTIAYSRSWSPMGLSGLPELWRSVQWTLLKAGTCAMSENLGYSSFKSTISHNKGQVKEFSLNDSHIRDLACSDLLPESEVCMWVQHLETDAQNRKQGATIAGAMRRAKAETRSHLAQWRQTFQLQRSTLVPLQCWPKSVEYVEEFETEEPEDWIQCDLCLQWFHWDCVGLVKDPEEFTCGRCNTNVWLASLSIIVTLLLYHSGHYFVCIVCLPIGAFSILIALSPGMYVGLEWGFELH